jgi:large subunit ribosomal protein L10
MKKEDKKRIIDDLIQKIVQYKHFYITDIGSLNAEKTSALRRKCFEKNIELLVVKNTLLEKALERSSGDYQELYPALKENTAVMFCESANMPAKLIKEFRKKNDKPVFKAAYVEESVYFGENQLEALFNLKSKEELIGEIIMLLQSPMSNVMSALNSGSNTITGVLKTLEERQ